MYTHVCTQTHEYFKSKTQSRYQHSIILCYLCFRCCRDLHEEKCWRSLRRWSLGPSRNSTAIILVALSFSKKIATQLYIQCEQLVSSAPVDKHNVMNYTNRMGSACVYSEAGLTSKRPFRNLLTEEGRLLKMFL